MVGRGILDGDYRDDSARSAGEGGDIIAARLGDEATVKTLTHRDGHDRARAGQSRGTRDRRGDADDFAMLGVVCGVFRPFQEVQQHEELSLAE